MIPKDSQRGLYVAERVELDKWLAQATQLHAQVLHYPDKTALVSAMSRQGRAEIDKYIDRTGYIQNGGYVPIHDPREISVPQTDARAFTQYLEGLGMAVYVCHYENRPPCLGVLRKGS